MADLFTYDSTWLIISEHLRGCLSGHCLDGFSSLIERGDQRFNFAAQFLIICAGFRDEASPLGTRTLNGGLEDLLYLLPPFGGHDYRGKCINMNDCLLRGSNMFIEMIFFNSFAPLGAKCLDLFAHCAPKERQP